MKKQNDKLDLFKGIAIYGVILLHILLPGRVGVAANCLARFGVPLFFLSAGYYSWHLDRRTLARRTARTARLLLWACLAPLCLGCVLAARSGQPVVQYLAGRVTSDTLRDLLLYQLFPLPYSWPMWFLAALLMIYLLWWALTAVVGPELNYDALSVLAAALLAGHLGLGEVRFLLGGQVDSLVIRNVWLDGIPFFLLGGWMSEHRDWWERIPGRVLWGGVAAGAALSLLERSLTTFLDLHAGTILMALSLMAVAVNTPEVRHKWLRNTLGLCGRKLTFHIFALHIPIYGILQEWRSDVAAFGWIVERPWLLPFAVALLTTLFALILQGLFASHTLKKEAC